MAHPKRKTSKQRKRKRRTHYKAQKRNTVTCPNCSATHEYHRVCPECGFYRGQMAIEKGFEA
ncbi:MAG: 50S ribosomal protein L32 [Bacteroidales bacterium]|nr:50S ribosomal protein L32 [Bacteroidales bacterium]MBS3774729.1 50S ribosomal protein L32 [Bacteroidales bacterium]